MSARIFRRVSFRLLGAMLALAVFGAPSLCAAQVQDTLGVVDTLRFGVAAAAAGERVTIPVTVSRANRHRYRHRRSPPLGRPMTMVTVLRMRRRRKREPIPWTRMIIPRRTVTRGMVGITMRQMMTMMISSLDSQLLLE